jgi:alkylation response protein AidB-like acyl-CoA dehydrogenase
VRLSLREDQQAIVVAFDDFFRKESPPERVRAAEPLGFDADLWRALVDVGGPGIAVSETLGGAGGSLLDAALVAEQLGRRVAPVPLVAATVAGRAFARSGEIGRPHLDALLAGEAVVALALRPARDGVAVLVPWGAVADRVVALVDDELVVEAVDAPPPARLGLGAEAPADVPVGSGVRGTGVVLAAGADATARHATALDEWRALQAAVLVGVAAEALAQAVAYAKVRHQFGRPIGSFQALAHGLVDAATAIDGARLLAYEAAWAADADPGRFPALASMAFAFAADTAPRVTATALHAHGGSGFMEETDVQLHHRRAKAWALVHDGVAGELGHLADVLWGPRGGPVPREGA